MVEVTHLVLPNDANRMGNCLGGRVMYWIDLAAALAASRHCRRNVVTASIDSLDFHRPIRVGDAVHLRARVTFAGRTSMEVEVEVFSEDLHTGLRQRTSTAYLTFVAVDAEGRPVPVPPVVPVTDEERERYRQGQARRRERLRRLGRAGGRVRNC